jgi:hypothetical protein
MFGDKVVTSDVQFYLNPKLQFSSPREVKVNDIFEQLLSYFLGHFVQRNLNFFGEKMC